MMITMMRNRPGVGLDNVAMGWQMPRSRTMPTLAVHLHSMKRLKSVGAIRRHPVLGAHGGVSSGSVGELVDRQFEACAIHCPFIPSSWTADLVDTQRYFTNFSQIHEYQLKYHAKYIHPFYPLPFHTG